MRYITCACGLTFHWSSCQDSCPNCGATPFPDLTAIRDFRFQKHAFQDPHNHVYDILDMENSTLLLTAKYETVNGLIASIGLYDTSSLNQIAEMRRSPADPASYDIIIDNQVFGKVKRSEFWEYQQSDGRSHAYMMLKTELTVIPTWFTTYIPSRDSIFMIYRKTSPYAEPILLGHYFAVSSNLDMSQDSEGYLHPYVAILLGLICEVLFSVLKSEK